MATEKELENAEKLKQTTQELIELRKEFTSIGTQALSTSTERLANETEILEKEKQQLVEARALLQSKIETAELSEEELENARKQLEFYQKQITEKQKLVKANAAYVNISKQADDIFESIAGRMMITRSASADMFKNIRASYREARKTDNAFKAMAKTAAAIGNSFLNMFSPINLLSSAIKLIFTESFEMLKRTTDAYAGFVQATGTFGVNLRAGMDLAAGVNIEQAAAAAGGLVQNFKGFLDLQGPIQGQILKTAGRLERIGVSSADFGQSLEFMGKALGMGERQASRIVTGIASAAADLGMTSAQAVSQFREMSGTLALYGPRIDKKFRQIAAAAKASGLEISEVVALGEQFDTFEGATRAVGQLNAYLGGPVLDSMELFYLQVEKGPEAVQKHVVDTLKAQGKSIETMSYSEQKAFAETLNMKVEGFQKLMGFQSKEAKAAEEKAAKEQKAQERFQKSLRRTLTFAEKIQIALQTIFDNKKLQDAINRLFGKTIDFGRDTKTIFKDVGDILADIVDGIAAAVEGLRGLNKALGGGWKTISKIAGAWAALRFGPSVAKAIFKGLAPKKPTRVVIVGGGTGRGGKGAGAAAGLGGLAAGGIGATAMAKRGSKERKKLAKEKWAERARKKGIEPSKVPTGMKGGLMKRLVKKGGLKVAGRALGSLLGVGFLAGGVMELVEEIPKISAGKGIGAALKDAALGTASFGIYEGSDAPQAKALQEIKSSTTKKARESAKKEDDKTKEIGKQIAMGFIEEMKNNNEPSKIEFKFTFDDIVGANSPVHDILWNSINNSMVKKTA